MTAPIIKLKTMYTITLPQTALKQVHLLYIIVDVFLITQSFFFIICTNNIAHYQMAFAY